jgi:hypothetical protein
VHFQERVNINCGLEIIIKFESKGCNATVYVNDLLNIPNKWSCLNCEVVY